MAGPGLCHIPESVRDMTWAWIAAAFGVIVTLYAYGAYPVALWAASIGRGRRSAYPPLDKWPLVTVTLPVFNEERVIARTLEAVLALDYPKDRLHVLIISDASTDRTDEIVGRYANRGVRLIRLAKRSGKSAAENTARTHLRGELVVNTDASVRLHPSSLKHLVAPFADPTVGIASGRDVSVARAGGDANVGESGYVGYEMWVRDLETRLGGIVGASGCFYASRIPLHMEMVPEALSRDFAAPLIAREQGFRTVSVADAVCYVPRTTTIRREYRRKVRTMARGLETLFFKRRLLNPLRYGFFAWKLISHKLVRWLVPWAIVIGAAGVVGLATELVWARLAAVAMSILAAIGFMGWWWPHDVRMPRFVGLPAYLVWGVAAGIHAWVKALRGDLNPIWEPTRRDPLDATVEVRETVMAASHPDD